MQATANFFEFCLNPNGKAHWFALVRGQAAEANSGIRRTLFERSELRSPRICLCGAGDPKGHARMKWFGALLPKQKCLVTPG